jgi:hypothetical protein
MSKEIILPKESFDGKEISISRDRKITLRQPNMREHYLFNKVCVSRDGKPDDDLRSFASPLCYIGRIDGTIFDVPNTSDSMERMLENFIDEDFSKILEAVKESREVSKEQIKK